MERDERIVFCSRDPRDADCVYWTNALKEKITSEKAFDLIVNHGFGLEVDKNSRLDN